MLTGRSLATTARTVALAVVLTAASVVAGLLLPEQVHGQGYNPIRVIHQGQELTFPDRFRLTLTAESERSITGVQVNYRPRGSSIWSYASPGFTPSRRATVTFNGILDRSSFLPPGTLIEYYWSIEDAAGNSRDTAPETLRYTDNRFDWQEMQAGPLTLMYHDLPDARARQAARRVEAQLQAVQELMGLPDVRAMRGFVYNNYQEAAPAFPFQSRTITERQMFHGFAFPSARVFLGIGLRPRLLVHESAHLILSQKLAGSPHDAPAWLDEGLASYVEPGAAPHSGQSLAGLGPSLPAMSSVSGTPEDIRFFYLKSESVVAFLVEEHSADAFRQFLGILAAGSEVDPALLRVYGFDTAGLEAHWSVSDRGEPLSSGNRFNPTALVLTLNTGLLGGLILLVMAAWAVQYIIRKLRARREDEDPEGYDGPPWDE